MTQAWASAPREAAAANCCACSALRTPRRARRNHCRCASFPRRGEPAYAHVAGDAPLQGETPMKALVLYVIFVVIGAAISIFVGYEVEKHASTNLSLVIFLAMFFANFAIAWFATVLAIDGSLRDIHGRAGQLAAEAEGRAMAERRRAT